jgi:hypothetical protein
VHPVSPVGHGSRSRGVGADEVPLNDIPADYGEADSVLSEPIDDTPRDRTRTIPALDPQAVCA